MSLVGSRRWATAPPDPATRDSNSRHAATPISYVGWATTVNAGLTTSAHSASSNPSSDTSSGHRIPAREMAWNAPSDCMASKARMAVGGLSNANSRVVSASPSSRR